MTRFSWICNHFYLFGTSEPRGTCVLMKGIGIISGFGRTGSRQGAANPRDFRPKLHSRLPKPAPTAIMMPEFGVHMADVGLRE